MANAHGFEKIMFGTDYPLSDYKKELAYYDIVKMHNVWENLWVVNIFSQNEDFTTNYDKLKLIVKDLKNQIKKDCKLWLENETYYCGSCSKSKYKNLIH